MTIEFLAIGRVIRPHGVRGELLLQSLTDFPERLSETETIYLGPAGETPSPHPLTGYRQHHDSLLVTLADCPNREAAEAYRGQIAQVRAEAAPPPPPGYYYHHQIIGLTAVSDQGETLGEVTEILETGANDVYIVRGPAGELLLPAISTVILSVDLPGRRLNVHLLDGLRAP